MRVQLVLAEGAGLGVPVWVFVVTLVPVAVGVLGLVLRGRDGARPRKQRRLPPGVQAHNIAGKFDGSERVVIAGNATTLDVRQICAIAWSRGYVYEVQQPGRSLTKGIHFVRADPSRPPRS